MPLLFSSHGGATSLDMVSSCPVETVTLYSYTLIGDSCDIALQEMGSSLTCTYL